MSRFVSLTLIFILAALTARGQAWAESILLSTPSSEKALAPDVLEPNNSAETASPTALDQTITGLSIDPSDDQDWFALTITEQTGVTIETVTNGDTVMELFDSGLNSLAYNDDGGQGFASRIDLILVPGDYYIQVGGYGGGMVDSYDLAVRSATFEQDALEPNDSAETASPIALDQTITGLSLIPYGEEDWFTLTITEQTGVTIETMTVGDIYVFLYDSNQGFLTYGYRQIDTVLPPGDYFIMVYSENGVVDSYDLAVRSATFVQDALELNNSPATASPIALEQTITDLSISPANDRDWFVLTITEQTGVIIETMTIGETYVYLYASNQDYLADGYRQIDTVLPPGDYFIMVYSENGVVDSYDLAVRSATFEQDALEPNDSAETASPIALDQTIADLSIIPSNDYDWFALTITEQTGVTIETMTIGDTVMELFDASLNSLAYDDDNGQGFASRIDMILVPGDYYILVNEYGGGTVNSYDLAAHSATLEPDALEPNDTREAAAPLSIPGAYSDLNLIPDLDGDWYLLSLDAPTYLTLEVDLFYGYIWISIIDGQGNELAFGSLWGNFSTSFSVGLPAGAAHINVSGHSFSTYSLSLSGSELGPDGNEPNNDQASGTELLPGQDLHNLSILESEDEDWFTFTLTEPATVTLAVNHAVGGSLDIAFYDGQGRALNRRLDGSLDESSAASQVLTLPAGVYLVRLALPSPMAPIIPFYDLSLTTRAVPLTALEEPNDASSLATVLTQDKGIVDYSFSPPKDTDWYTFDVVGPVVVRLQSSPFPDGLVMNIYDSQFRDVGVGIPVDQERDYVFQAVLNTGHYFAELHEPDEREIAVYTLALSFTQPGANTNADVNGDGELDEIDAQFVLFGSVGLETPYETDLNHDGSTSASDMQLAINSLQGIQHHGPLPLPFFGDYSFAVGDIAGQPGDTVSVPILLGAEDNSVLPSAISFTVRFDSALVRPAAQFITSSGLLDSAEKFIEYNHEPGSDTVSVLVAGLSIPMPTIPRLIDLDRDGIAHARDGQLFIFGLILYRGHTLVAPQLADVNGDLNGDGELNGLDEDLALSIALDESGGQIPILSLNFELLDPVKATDATTPLTLEEVAMARADGGEIDGIQLRDGSIMVTPAPHNVLQVGDTSTRPLKSNHAVPLSMLRGPAAADSPGIILATIKYDPAILAPRYPYMTPYRGSDLLEEAYGLELLVGAGTPGELQVLITGGCLGAITTFWDAVAGSVVCTCPLRDSEAINPFPIGSLLFDVVGEQGESDLQVTRVQMANLDNTVSPSGITSYTDIMYDAGGSSGSVVILDSTDTDGDLIPDAWETDNGLNHNDASDGTTDPDNDGFNNREEFELSSDPFDSGDPASRATEVFVSPIGGDDSGDGSLLKPWGSIAFAIGQVAQRASEARPITVRLLEGVFNEQVVMRPYVNLAGAGSDKTTIRFFNDVADSHFVVYGADNTSLSDLTVTFPSAVSPFAVLVRVKSASMQLENLVLDGKSSVLSVGLLVSGESSSGTMLRESVVRGTQSGVWAIQSGATLTRNTFEHIGFDGRGVGVLVNPPSDFRKIISKASAALTPDVGTATEPRETGFNRFRDIDGALMVNTNPESTTAEVNDWGFYTLEEIEARVLELRGPVDVVPFLGKAMLTGSALVAVVDRATNKPVPASANAHVRIQSIPLDAQRDSSSGYYVFSVLPEGLYFVQADADGYASGSASVTISPSGSARVVVIELSREGATPIADFRATPTRGAQPLRVHFEDLSSPGSSPISNWQWDFGDGTQTAGNAQPFHMYVRAGTYGVSLKVTNATGSDTTLVQNLINASALSSNPDVNGIGGVNAIDIQLVINGILGLLLPEYANADVNFDGVWNAIDIQLVINAALGIV